MDWESLWKDWLWPLPYILALGYFLYAGSLRKRMIWLYLVLAGPLFGVPPFFLPEDTNDFFGIITCYVFAMASLLVIHACCMVFMKERIKKRPALFEVFCVGVCSPLLAIPVLVIITWVMVVVFKAQ